MQNLKNFLAFILILFFPAVYPETIIMKSGKILKGQVVDHDSDSIVIQHNQERKSISKDLVYKIIYSNNSTEVKNIITKEKKQIARAQRELAIEKRRKRKEQIIAAQNRKNKTNASVQNLSSKIQKLEKKISRLRSKIKKLKKSIN